MATQQKTFESQLDEAMVSLLATEFHDEVIPASSGRTVAEAIEEGNFKIVSLHTDKHKDPEIALMLINIEFGGRARPLQLFAKERRLALHLSHVTCSTYNRSLDKLAKHLRK